MKEAYILQNIVWINAEVLLPPPDTPVLVYRRTDQKIKFYIMYYNDIIDGWHLMGDKNFIVPQRSGLIKAWTFMHAPDEFKEIFKEV